jgi:hypothetical protein
VSKVKHVVLAITVGGISPTAPLATADPYRYVVSVGCADPDGRTIKYVWHTDALPNAEGERVFKVLAGSDFEECLSEIARTTSELFERLTSLGPKSGDEVMTATMREVSDLWSQHGVYGAVREVASTGTRGTKVQALMLHCDDLRHDRIARYIRHGIRYSGKQFVAAALEVVGKPEAIQDILTQKVRLLEVFASRGREFKAGDILDFSNAEAVDSLYLGILVPMKSETFGSTFLLKGATDDDRKQFATELAAAGFRP